MKPSERDLFHRCHQMLSQGHVVFLLTVSKTWGSSPRPAGSLAAIFDDGTVLGSVSGGCVEEELVSRLIGAEVDQQFPTLYSFGNTPETARLIPCQSTLEILVEKITDPDHFSIVFESGEEAQLTRKVNLQTGEVQWEAGSVDKLAEFLKTENTIVRHFANQWRLILFGNTPVSRQLCHFAKSCGFDVVVCDPRDVYDVATDIPVNHTMPDELVLKHANEKRTAFIALSHDPKVDDMALMEALKSESFYVGAMGSKSNNERRRERLATLDLNDEHIQRLHGPVGLPINSKTPEEIAISILAHIICEKNRICRQQHIHHY